MTAPDLDALAALTGWESSIECAAAVRQRAEGLR